LGVTALTVGAAKNALDTGYGSAWSATNVIVGYMHTF